jgi:hypothetical protein
MMMPRVYCVLLALMFTTAGLLMAGEVRLPAPAEIVACSADSNPGGLDYWKDLRVSCDQFKNMLEGARVVPESTWLHEYNHVAGGDRWGDITLRDGTKVRWMVRPGGLGLLEWPDRSKVHLVFCQCNDAPTSIRPGHITEPGSA